AIQLDPQGLSLDALAAEQNILRRALETNQEILEAEHERRARERRLEGEKGAKWPTLDLGAEYQVLSRSNNYEDFFRKFQRNNFNIGIQLRLPIFSADRSAKVALAKSELTVAEIDLKDKRQNLELEIK